MKVFQVNLLLKMYLQVNRDVDVCKKMGDEKMNDTGLNTFNCRYPMSGGILRNNSKRRCQIFLLLSRIS